MSSDTENDYRLPALEVFINEDLNPIFKRDEVLTRRYHLLHATVIYFEYAVGQVRAQESALKNNEPDAAVVAAAIATYLYIHNCFVMFDEAVSGIFSERELASEFRTLKGIRSALRKRAEEIRHSIAAHPEGKKEGARIAPKRNMKSTDGRVRIGRTMLHPRKDLEELRKYFEDTGLLLKRASI